MRKRLSRLALVLALSIVLSGCSGKTPQMGTITPNPTTVTQVPETTQIPETTASAPEETEAPTVSLGRMVGGVYENTYTGYGCALDDDWEYYTAQEIQDISALTQEMLQNTELLEENEEYQHFFDMMAENVTNLTSINIGYGYKSLQDRLALALLAEEEYIDAVLDQKDMMVDAYAQSGMTLHSVEKVQVNFLGQERWAIHIEATIAGDGVDIPYYLVQLFDTKPGGTYLVTLTLASYVEDNTEALLDLFYPVSE